MSIRITRTGETIQWNTPNRTGYVCYGNLTGTASLQGHVRCDGRGIGDVFEWGWAAVREEIRGGKGNKSCHLFDVERKQGRSVLVQAGCCCKGPVASGELPRYMRQGRPSAARQGALPGSEPHPNHPNHFRRVEQTLFCFVAWCGVACCGVVWCGVACCMTGRIARF